MLYLRHLHALRCESAAKDAARSAETIFQQLVARTAALLAGRVAAMGGVNPPTSQGASPGGVGGVAAWLQTLPQAAPPGSSGGAGPPLHRSSSSGYPPPPSSVSGSSIGVQRPSTSGGRAMQGVWASGFSFRNYHRSSYIVFPSL